MSLCFIFLDKKSRPVIQGSLHKVMLLKLKPFDLPLALLALQLSPFY